MDNSTKPLIVALLKARKAFRPALKSATNPHYGSKFVDLASALEAVEDALHDEDILLTQPVKVVGDTMLVCTTLTHVTGDSMESQYPVIVASQGDPQKLGSAVTYARRYSLMALLGIAGEDNDGTTTSEKPERKERVGKKSGPAPEIVEPPMPGRKFASESQRRDLMAALDNIASIQPDFTEGSKDDQKKARLWYLGRIVGRKLETTAELTVEECDTCIAQAREEA